MKNFKLFIATLVLTVFSVNVWGETYTKATSLKAGDEIVLVCEAKSMELTDISTTSTKYGIGTSYTTSVVGTYVFEVVAGSETNSFSFKTGSNYLRWNSGNSLDVVATSVAKNSSWLVTFDADGNATIKNANNETRVIWWNVGSPRFACYTDKSDGNDYKYVQLYKKAPSCTDPTTPLSITIAATVKTGKTITLASTGGNGGTVEWSVTNGTGSATIANGILTAGNVGTVTVKAHQDQNGTTCETDAEQTVTISAITYTDYITECSSDPSISVSTAELSGFTYIYSQGPSAAKTVTVNGFYLQNNVTVTASDNYEICLSQDGTYTSTINLTPADQMVNAPIYVRLKAGKDVNSYNGTLTVASTGLDSKTVSLSGSVTRAQLATPSVTATPDVHQITLTWDAVPNASSYQLVWNDGAAETVTSPVTKTNLTGGQSYSYSLVAVGSGNYTNSAAATGNQTAGKETFTVTWNIGANQETTANIEEGTLFSSLTPPTVADDAAGDCANKFIGWAIEAISSSEGVAENQVNWVDVSSAISASNKEFYAVFANQSGSASVFSDDLNISGTNEVSNRDGWSTLYKIWAGSGSVRLGSNSYSGYLITDALSINGTATISFKIKKHDNATLVLSVEDGESGYVLSQTEFPAASDDSWTDCSCTLTGAGTNAKLKFYSYDRLYLKDVSVSCTSYSNYVTTCAPTYEISASTTNGSILWSLNGDEFGSTIGKQPEGRTVYFQLQPDLHYQVSGTPTSSDVDIEDEGSGIYSFEMPASAVTISAAFTLKSTVIVTFKNNGETLTTDGTREIYVGEAIGELPVLTSSDACDQTSTTFIGWMIGDISGKSETPSVMVDETTKITEDINLNAVWAEQTGAQTTITPSATLNNYYANISGKSGDELRTTLGTIISTDYSEVSYDNLRYLLKYADTENANGTDLIDIYSPCTFTIVDNAISWSGSCSGATNVGCGLNREHTVPQSWFNEQSPMVSDAFHIYAVDAASNGHRSNYFYGECTSGTSYTGANCDEAGKLGSSSRQGYNGIVYEPADEYKGDIARGFFYMATRYAAQCSSWSNMFGSNKGLTDYTVALMLDWHRQDPVSEKELIRNEVIYGNSTYNPSAYKQNNRNPFIDYPELVEHIWGNQSATPVNLTSLSSAYENSGYTGYMTHCTYTIEVNEQPIDVTCYQDDNASLIFSVSLVGGTGTLSYQWQSSANGTDGWTDIANATSPTYKPSTNAIGVTYYRCVVTSEKATPVASNVVAVTVNQKLSNKYTITYAYQGWSTDAGSQVLEVDGGSTVTLPTLTSLGMTQEGYNFVKWEMSDGTQHDPDYQFTMPTENIVISAVLEEIQQNITYTVNGSAAAQLTDWTTQPDKVNYWDEDLTAEYTITQGYHVSTAAVTVNGVALTAETEFLFDDKTITIMPAAKKFAGAVSITLTIEPMVYTVYLSALEATNDYTKSVEATFGQDMPAIATLPIRPGYTFLGYSYTDQETSITTQYYTSAGASAHAWDIPAGATLTAQWSTVSYGITYTETTNLTWGEKPATVNVETDMLTANYTVTNGYEVTGMTVTVGGATVDESAVVYDNETVVIETTFSGAVVITPTVTPIHYTITYLKNDGSATSSTQDAVYMENVTLKNGTAFNRKGYTIDHWATEDETVTYDKGHIFEPYNLTSDLTLKAIWAVKESDWYTITFVDQLQDNEVEPISGILTVDGFTFPTLEDRETPPDDTGQCNIQHYHFMGWIAEGDKDNEITESNIIKGGTEVSAASVTANATYYAIWATATIQ